MEKTTNFNNYLFAVNTTQSEEKSDSVSEQSSGLVTDFGYRVEHHTSRSFLKTEHNFTNHLQNNEIKSSSWLIFFLLTGLALLSWTRSFQRNRLNLIFNSFFSAKQLAILDRDRKLSNDPVSIALMINYMITSGALLMLLYQKFVYDDFSGRMMIHLGGVAVLLMLLIFYSRTILIDLIGNIFRTEHLAYHHKLNNMIFGMFSGIIMLLLIPIFYYTFNQEHTIILLITLLIVFIVKVFRLFTVGIRENQFSYIYLFLYLCTLEIVPLLILVKFVSKEIIG